MTPACLALPGYAAPAITIILAVIAFALLRLSFATPAHAANLFDGGSDQARITGAVKRDQRSVVALEVCVRGTQYVPIDPFGDTALCKRCKAVHRGQYSSTIRRARSLRTRSSSRRPAAIESPGTSRSSIAMPTSHSCVSTAMRNFHPR